MTRLDSFTADATGRVDAGFYACRGEALASNGSLRAALDAHAHPVIAELKPRSPSEGRLLQGPAEAKLADYVTGGAAAISCLADADHFDGGPELVRQAVATGLPVLWKDFIVDEAQVDAAHHHGASAILLIERILDPARREALVQRAHERGLEVLLEVFSEQDWGTAQQSSAELIGVNARDLETLHVDAEGAAALLTTISAQRPVVALSGITRRAQRRRAMQQGACAVLVGTHLMHAPDARLALRALQRPLAKVCGVRDAETVDACADASADLVGFVVGAPDSPRNIEPIRAQQLSDHAKERGLRTVLVTPHADDWEVREWCRVVRPDYVQLHGIKPSPEWLHSLSAIPTIPIHVLGPGGHADGAFLLDTSHGTGRKEAWADGAGDSDHLSLVAGGLDAATAPAAIEGTRAWGADASSGLESAPGVKDTERIRAYVEACHAA